MEVSSKWLQSRHLGTLVPFTYTVGTSFPPRMSSNDLELFKLSFQTTKNWPNVKSLLTGDSICITPVSSCVCSQYNHLSSMIPISGGIDITWPLTKMSRCAWLWNRSCFSVSHFIPLMVEPDWEGFCHQTKSRLV